MQVLAGSLDRAHSFVREEPVLGHEGGPHEDVLAAGAAQARDEPRVLDLVVTARNEEEPWALLLREAGKHSPLRVVAAAREIPSSRQQPATVRLVDFSTRGIESGGSEYVGRGGEIFFLGSFRVEAQQPVVAGPDRIAPCRRPVTPAELGTHLQDDVVVEAVASVAIRIRYPEESRLLEIVYRLIRDSPELLGLQCSTGEQGHKLRRAPQELFT